MWLADQITSKGVGNGVSMIIFVGIVSSVPRTFVTAYNEYVGSNLSAGAQSVSKVSYNSLYMLYVS